ncbi:MAG: hypothetical protein ACRDL1_08105 [Solirubrobacterales bacterium]
MPERINAGQVLVVAGAVALFASLFLSWYEPRFTGEDGLSAWTAFELLDIVLAGLALVAIAAVVPFPREGGAATLLAGRWLPWLGLAAVVLVLVSVINDPPGARDRGLELGAWIGLAGAVAMAVGGLMSYARVSLVISLRPADERPTEETPTATSDTSTSGA